jgi:WD40 repeat protein
VLTSLANRAIADQNYESAMRIALQGLPAPGHSPLALGWSTSEISGLEAKLAGAAALSPLLRELRGHGGAVTSAAFSPDGARIVTASFDQTARVWDADSGQMLRELKGHSRAVNSAALSTDGARIVTASSDNTARVWDAASDEMLRELKGHGSPVMSAAFSPDGARIVTASGDTTARVWDAASGQMLRELKGHSNLVYSAAFSPDGARIVTASWDKTARVWDVSWETNVRREDLVRRVCTEKLVGGRAFTTEDAADPILAALSGQDPCERTGPFAATYWTDLGHNIWRWVSAELAPAFSARRAIALRLD